MTMYALQNYVHCEDFPFPVSFISTAEWDRNATGVHFWVDSAQHSEPCVKLALVFCFSVNQS